MRSTYSFCNIVIFQIVVNVLFCFNYFLIERFENFFCLFFFTISEYAIRCPQSILNSIQSVPIREKLFLIYMGRYLSTFFKNSAFLWTPPYLRVFFSYLKTTSTYSWNEVSFILIKIFSVLCAILQAGAIFASNSS